MNLPPEYARTIFFLRIGKHDAEQVAETLQWGADPNWSTPKGTPAIVRAVRGLGTRADLVELLLKAGADPSATDASGCTALDHVRRRLLMFEGKPRKPPYRSPSLSPGGELILDEREWKHIEDMQREFPDQADKIEEDYLAARRKTTRPHDARAELEAIRDLLEPLKGNAPP